MIIDKDKLELVMASLQIGSMDLLEQANITPNTLARAKKGENLNPL